MKYHFILSDLAKYSMSDMKNHVVSLQQLS